MKLVKDKKELTFDELLEEYEDTINKDAITKEDIKLLNIFNEVKKLFKGN